MIKSQTIRDERLGIIHIRTRKNIRNYNARWIDNEVVLTGPAFATAAEYRSVIDELTPRLLARRAQQLTPDYHDGFTFSTDDWTFTLRCHSSMAPGRVKGVVVRHPSLKAFEVWVAPSTDFTHTPMRKAISDVIKRIAASIAPQFLIPQAQQEISALALSGKVTSLGISRGLRTLGKCDARGGIMLSATLMFMPRSLRRSTITHELAHLTHFDHSPNFNSLWDSYLGYSHTISKQRIREMQWPIIK